MMDPWRWQCEFILVVFFISQSHATQAYIKTTDDNDGTCQYELRVPKVSCQQCKCKLDDADNVISELRGRLASIEKQLPQFLRKEESQDLPTSSITSIDPLVFTKEGAISEDLQLSTTTEPEIAKVVWDSKRGSSNLAKEQDAFFVNSPGTIGQMEAAPGYNEEMTAEGLVAVENQLIPVHNQDTDLLLQVTESMAATNGDSEDSPDGLLIGTTGTAQDKQLKTGGFVRGRSGSNTYSTTKAPINHPVASVATGPPLVGDDKLGLNRRPQWRLHDRPRVDKPHQDKPEQSEPLGRADARCMDGCSCLRSWGYRQNGVYDISNPPASGKTGQCIRAYCDMDTEGGAWTVIQNRMDGSRNFYRQWSSYANGFGRLESDFWIGNNLLHGLTKRINYQLRVEFSDWTDEEGYAEYAHFLVGSSDDKYRLTLGRYMAGSHGDSLSYHNNSCFSTYDQDNDASSDVNCAELRQAGFWFQACNKANPNGRYIYRPGGSGLNGGIITWGSWPEHGYHYALKTFRMMIRPVHYDRILYY